MTLQLSVQHRDPNSRARAGVLETARGPVETPQFMPVGTRATVKGVFPRDLTEMGATVVLANAFHLALRPGAETVKRLGGLHAMMDWPGPILTDSGGFQVFSLASLRTLDDGGVTFRSPLDGELVRLTPESCMDLQRALGADLTMVLDVCPPGGAPRSEVEAAVERSVRWARKCLDDHARAAERGPVPRLLAIVQGGIHADLRVQCARELVAMDFDAYAVGGLSVGESKEGMRQALDAVGAVLPEDRPRYLMGVGAPADLLDAVERGMDLFDCVLPTREGRNARAYTSRGIVHVRNAALAEDRSPLDPACPGICCQRYSRGTLRHLFQAGEMLGPMLLSLHNLRFFLDLMARTRRALAEASFQRLASEVRAVFPHGDSPPEERE